MAAPLLAAMCRLRILSASPPALLGRRSLRSRPPLTPFPRDDREPEPDSDGDGDWEDTVQQDVKSALKRRQKAILIKRMKRELEPPEPAERRLTWNAMQQIRYLRQEFPEEWPLDELAQGFNVSTETIKKVLKSKFVPSEARRMKQDAHVFRVTTQNSAGSTKDQPQLRPPARVPAQPLIPSQENRRQLPFSQSNQLLPPQSLDSTELALISAHETKSLATTQESQSLMQGVFQAVSSQGLTTETQTEPVQTAETEEDEGILDEHWDGEVLSDKELEELADSGVPNKMKVVQKGREYFDDDGNFLYSI